MSYNSYRMDRIRRISGIQYMENLKPNTNRYYGDQFDKYKGKNNGTRKNNSQSMNRKTENQTRRYKSSDSNMIYFTEYYRVRNTILYRELNGEKNEILQYKNKYGNLSPNSYDKAIEAYNKTRKNADIIDFVNRRKDYVIEVDNSVIDFSEKSKQLNKGRKKKETNKNLKPGTASKTTEKNETTISKKTEMKNFKDSLRNNASNNTVKTLDDAVIEFQKALDERNKFDQELLGKRGKTTISGARSTISRNVSRSTAGTTRNTATTKKQTTKTTTTTKKTKSKATMKKATTSKKTTTRKTVTKKSSTKRTTTRTARSSRTRNDEWER